MRQHWLAFAACIYLVTGHAQVNSPEFQGLFLVGEFGELCTMCQATVLCESGEELPAYDIVPDQGEFTLYYIQTRTFWSQIATIWEWFIANFDASYLAEGHTRPVWVYAVTGATWFGPTLQEATMALDPPVMTLGAQQIDRKTRSWRTINWNDDLGFCQRMPLWDAIDVINRNAPGEPDDSTN